ncbi:MAG TPA: 5'/3'-nucleotidase SurE [Acidimicrobiia bacterium]|nr:5'/3'-nucleotidase SurE [Acidimicrobiia bacterium]
MTKVLVTNDDGIESSGLHVLAAALDAAGYDTTVVAPDRDRSGIGAAIGLVHADQHLDVEKVEMPGCEGIPAYAIDGPPGLCVCAARLGAFGEPPDIVVSGVNPGCNTGRAILHSGTVGAALTAQSFGCSALAVSVGAAEAWRFDTAARVAIEVLPMLLDAPPRSVLNLNVPGLDYDAVRGVRWARLAAFGSVRAAIAGSGDGGVQIELRTTGVSPPPDSDQGLVDAGFAALTTIIGVAEAWPTEQTGAGDVSSDVVPGARVEPVHAVPDASAPRSLHRPLHATPTPKD